MSAGHHVHSAGMGAVERRKILSDPKVRKDLKRPVKIDRTFDIPYLAGYSDDGGTIYIDRHLPASIKIKGKPCNAVPFLLVHERTEKALIDALGYEYAAAHEIASGQEDDAVRKAGRDPKAYNDALKPYIKSDEVERLVRVPPDLDLTPYKGEEALLKRIKSASGKKVSKTSADYSRGSNAEHCSICAHYHDRRCEIVEGWIDPAYWCKYWQGKSP